MNLRRIRDVVFDGSTRPGTVLLNETRMRFETEEDARFVFDLLNSQKSELLTAQLLLNRVRDDSANLLARLETLATPK